MIVHWYFFSNFRFEQSSVDDDDGAHEDDEMDEMNDQRGIRRRRMHK